MFTVRRWVEIDAGHRVPYHGSHCRHLHGHRYRITAVVEAARTVPVASRQSDAGMVVDFGVIKKVLMEQIHSQYDHKLILWDQDPLLKTGFVDALQREGLYVDGFRKVIVIPTAEELAALWGMTVRQALWDAVKALPGRRPLHGAGSLDLMALEVRETPTSTAVWRPAPTCLQDFDPVRGGFE